jgi:hypothetical protein
MSIFSECLFDPNRLRSIGSRLQFSLDARVPSRYCGID